MKLKFKKHLLVLVALFIFLPVYQVGAVDQIEKNKDTVFKAEVIEILEEKESVNSRGETKIQQNLRLLGLEGDYQDKQVVFTGIGDFEVLISNTYKEGDKVLVVASQDGQRDTHYYITDQIRTNSLWFLVLVFVFVLLAVSRWKGLRSLISLGVTFFIIISFIIPQIISGANPLIITLIGSFLALLATIYITEGWTIRSHLAVSSVFLSLLLTLFLSWGFIELAQLSGMTGDEAFLLLDFLEVSINFKGLLLAGIVIGSLGILGDMVISQIATTEEIYKANNYLTRSKLFAKAYRVGSSHIASMVNTLFLAYAGAALPLLIIFSTNKGVFSSWEHIINTEIIATEIIRTLCGSIGLILAAPLATFLAVWYYKKRKLAINND